MGCVYILKNRAMPDLIKIGHTKRTARERANELYTTGVPEPFEIAHEFPCEDHERLEREIHKKLADHRNNPDREFFRYPADDALQTLRALHQRSWRKHTSQFLTRFRRKATDT